MLSVTNTKFMLCRYTKCRYTECREAIFLVEGFQNIKFKTFFWSFT
jgi:hypothetical protein